MPRLQPRGARLRATKHRPINNNNYLRRPEDPMRICVLTSRAWDRSDAVPGFLDGRDVPREMTIDLGEAASV
jgi:hypothetical protein